MEAKTWELNQSKNKKYFQFSLTRKNAIEFLEKFNKVFHENTEEVSIKIELK
jgi:hypothetical protein